MLFWMGGEERLDGVGILVAEKWVSVKRVLILKMVLDLCILYWLLDSCNLYKQMSSTLCICYPLYHYIFFVPTSDNKYTVLNYYYCLYHRHHMAILQHSALPSAIPH